MLRHNRSGPENIPAALGDMGFRKGRTTMNRKKMLTALMLAAALTVSAQAAVDLPGQKYHLRVSDLPKPYATLAVMNDAVMVPQPDGAMPKVPQGFKVNMFADIRGSRWMTFCT